MMPAFEISASSFGMVLKRVALAVSSLIWH